MSILTIVAHPDDEVLGCGGMVAALTTRGVTVQNCILSGQADAREQRPDIAVLAQNIHIAQSQLGCRQPILGDFPNIKFNTVPHLELVKFIENVIEETKPNFIFTHHPRDLNNDHHHTSLACQAAARLFQRRPSSSPLRGLYFMEILSSTDWGFPGSGRGFEPDAFFEIGDGFLQHKIEALQLYQGVMRDFPHPRSEEVIKGLAAFRGGQAGMRYAEAFQTAFRALTTSDFAMSPLPNWLTDQSQA